MSSFESLKLEFIHRIQLGLLMRPPGGGRLSAGRWETFAEANKTKSEKGGERVESESFPLGQSDARVRSQVALRPPPLSPPPGRVTPPTPPHPTPSYYYYEPGTGVTAAILPQRGQRRVSGARQCWGIRAPQVTGVQCCQSTPPNVFEIGLIERLRSAQL